MEKLTSVKLINHACFSFEYKGESVLVDPWFKGAIFNNSWRLVDEGGDVPDNLKYIFITHEHPDHLHWPTLKALADKKITICIPKRQNSNVKDNLKKLGYKVVEFYHGVRKKLKWLEAEYFNTGHDNAIVFKTKDLVMLNQNDCYLQQHVCHNIINKYPHIDIWWMQFSLAGYYGNQDHVKALQNAQKLHENHYASYKEIFNPVISIPFASFVYFCREENKELNKYRVPLTTIYENNPGTQVLYKGDEVMFGDSKSRSMKNILKWESHFRETLPMENPKGTVNELKSVITEFANKYGATGSISFELYDSEKYCNIDFDRREVDCEEPSNPIAKVTLFDLTEMFKNPWGADTMNITSCFKVYDEGRWKALLGSVDSLYVR